MHRQLEDDGPGFGRDIDTDVALFGVLHYRQLEKWLLLKIVAVRDHSDQVHVKEPQSYTNFTAMVTDILEDLGVVASNFNALPQHLLVSGKIMWVLIALSFGLDGQRAFLVVVRASLAFVSVVFSAFCFGVSVRVCSGCHFRCGFLDFATVNLSLH